MFRCSSRKNVATIGTLGERLGPYRMNLLVTQGALTTIYAGTHPTDIKGGAYYTDCTAGTVVSLPTTLLCGVTTICAVPVRRLRVDGAC
jgi:hypothetical protein